MGSNEQLHYIVDEVQAAVGRNSEMLFVRVKLYDFCGGSCARESLLSQGLGLGTLESCRVYGDAPGFCLAHTRTR